FVTLSLKHLNSDKIKKRFPFIYENCAKSGVDMSIEVPVAPAAHYMVGGIKTGLDGETNIKNLYACGEIASTGVMGANRLASNSLIECLVFGKRAIDHARQSKPNDNKNKLNKTSMYTNTNLESLFIQYKNTLADEMNAKVGIIRNKKELTEIITHLESIEHTFPFEECEYYSLRLQNLMKVCYLLTKAALSRQESRGGHFREDFPKQESKFLTHSIQQINKEICFIPINN
ncbi:FAD-binding protein, partial [Labilibaculum sp.]|uniref:FAD-binding protein n=1 Tax=Labilibaculum sp. TaxID=2060723 RepID=UPI0035647656